MRLRSVTMWTTRDGKRRRIKLYAAWDNMKGRAIGRLYSSNGSRLWAGLTIDFGSWREFRQWSLANGFSRNRCSLDRIDPTLGYAPANCRWITRSENSRWVHNNPYKRNFTGEAGPDVPF